MNFFVRQGPRGSYLGGRPCKPLKNLKTHHVSKKKSGFRKKSVIVHKLPRKEFFHYGFPIIQKMSRIKFSFENKRPVTVIIFGQMVVGGEQTFASESKHACPLPVLPNFLPVFCGSTPGARTSPVAHRTERDNRSNPSHKRSRQCEVVREKTSVSE